MFPTLVAAVTSSASRDMQYNVVTAVDMTGDEGLDYATMHWPCGRLSCLPLTCAIRAMPWLR